MKRDCSSCVFGFSLRIFAALCVGVISFLSCITVSRAQVDTTATITGRIFSPATGEYLRNAEVRLLQTGNATVSEDGGIYRFTGVSPGDVTVVVSYAGFRTVTATVTVPASGTITQDFDLISSLVPSDSAGTPLTLEKFVVATERAGNAKAIMDQRNSMNITNTVSSDVFGDDTEGNVGHFLKHMPGIELVIVGGEPRNIRLRGLDPEYTQVTVDGMSFANAAAGNTSRAFSFEQTSLSSVESIEVSKTISADVDANAPAGTINLKTKRAFDRQGRRISWQANLTGRNNFMTLDKTRGPDDGRTYKILPGGNVEYSDVFLNKRLGVLINVNESQIYGANTLTTATYSYSPTSADPRPVVPTAFAFNVSERINERFATTLTADFKATENLVLSLSYIYNYSDLWNMQRTVTFNTGARATVLGADPLKSFTTSATNASVAVSPLFISKRGNTSIYIPKFEYKRGNLLVEGKFSYSDSKSFYEPLSDRKAFFSVGAPTLTGITFQAERSSPGENDWKVTQTGGRDISSGIGFTTPTAQIDDGRFSSNKLFVADISATLKTNFRFPIVWKAGVKQKSETRDFDVTSQSFLYDYIGPGSGVGAWAGYNSPFKLEPTEGGGRITSLSGGSVFVPDVLAISNLYLNNPSLFSQTITAANYYTSKVLNRKHYEEDITAAFLMGSTRVGKTSLRAGIRWEQTETDSLEVDPRSASEVIAAGFPVVNSRATTVPGIEYQYLSKPRVHRRGSYDNFFPSASFKYKFTDAFDFHFGYSSTIRRPTFGVISGVVEIIDETLRVNTPNPGLGPETSDNFAARLSYYFEPVGFIAVNVFQNNVTNLHRSSQISAAEYGYVGDRDLSNYTFFTTTGSADETKIRGMEIEFRQTLSFLPRPFKSLTFRSSYTRNYAEVVIPNMSPHSATAGLSYAWRRLNLYSNLTWNDNVPFNIENTVFVRHRTNVDIGGGFRLTNRVELFFTARNVFDAHHIRIATRAGAPDHGPRTDVWGTPWVVGVKGRF